MPGRLLALGDIHGCLAALEAVLEAIEIRAEDTLVALGDYVDRGPHSRGVIDRLIALQSACRLVPLLGNHDELMLKICLGDWMLIDEWLMYGGDATLHSYGRVPDGVPKAHVDFLASCLPWYETQRHFFVHANYWPHLPFDRLPEGVLRWESLKARLPGPHACGKIGITGHSSQRTGEILDLGYLKCIDTWCYGNGWLTAMDVNTNEVWQADKHGRRRESAGEA